MKKLLRDGQKRELVDRYRLIYIPLVISIVGIILVSFLGYITSKNMLMEQVELDGISLAKQMSKQVRGNRASLNSVERILEEKIRISANWIVSQGENIDQERLLEFQKDLDVDEIHLIDPGGDTIYSTHEGYRDWKVPGGHPLDIFMNNSDEIMMEEVRPDAKYGILMKYGAIKAENGNILQMGIKADNIEKLTDKFDFQNIVSELGREDNVEYAYILTRDFSIVADSREENVGGVYKGYPEFEEALSGGHSVKEVKTEDGFGVLDIVYPVSFSNGEVGNIAVIGISMEASYSYLENILVLSILASIIIISIIIITQTKNIIIPIRNLHDGIHDINIEKNPGYRLGVGQENTFRGIAHSINDILDDTSRYFKEIEKNRRELEESEELISSAYQQLSASEEELRAQYDEIQSYTERLENLKRKYEIAIEGTGSAVWEIDVESGDVYFSRESQNVVPSSVSIIENIEEGIEAIFGEEGKKRFLKEYHRYIEGATEDFYLQMSHSLSGDSKKLLFQGKGIYKDGKLKTLSGIVMDITKLKDQEEYIEYLAHHDFLTGLPNRRTFLNRLRQEVELGGKGSVILLDLDNFKEINDTMGHIYGDNILKNIANKLEESFYEDNIYLSRFGGDEFLILIPDITNSVEVSEYADEVIRTLKSDIKINDENIYISSSLGITVYPEDSESVDQLIMNADMAMYKVKKSGKCSYTFYNESMIEEVKEKVEVEKSIRLALEEGGFKMVYQPQISVDTGELVGYEALIRMKEKSISPGLFIPIAEESELIVEIGRYVTEEVIKQIQEWTKVGLFGKRVAINFSAKQLNDDGYVDYLNATLSKYNVEASMLEIEITESIFLEKKQLAIGFLNRLKDLGVKIALDDFGTGYSSFSYLTFLPVDKIKLDKSLSDKFLDLESIKIMDSLISLSHSLGLEVIAEGVEEEAQFRRLKVGKCDFIQGYLFSKPLEADQAELVYNKNYLED